MLSAHTISSRREPAARKQREEVRECGAMGLLAVTTLRVTFIFLNNQGEKAILHVKAPCFTESAGPSQPGSVSQDVLISRFQ